MQHQTKLFTQFLQSFTTEHDILSKIIHDSKESNLKLEQLDQIIEFVQNTSLNLCKFSLFEAALLCIQIEKACLSLKLSSLNEEHTFNIIRDHFNQLPAVLEGNPRINAGSMNHISKNIDTTPLVYVVDDEPMLLELFEAMLQALPIRIKTFNNPEKAIEEFLFDRPSLILSDMKMSEMSGSDLLKKIRSIDQAVGFIFISGYINKDNVLDFMNLGVFSVIEKPFKAPEVLAIVDKALKNYQIKSTYNQTLEKVILKTHSIGNEEMKNLIDELLENRKRLFQFS